MNRPQTRSISLISTLAALLLTAAASPAQEFAALDVRFAYTMTADADAAGLNLTRVVPLGERTLLLASLSGLKADQSFGVLSAGLALRQLLPDEQTFIGGNIFYDALRNSDDYAYSQIGFGAEIVHGRFALRGNYYLPIGAGEKTETQRRSREEMQIDDGPDALTAIHTVTRTDEIFRTQRRAAQAWEVQFAVALFEQPRFIDTVAAIGFYGVEGEGHDYSGLTASLSARIAQHVTVGVEWRQDSRQIGQEWRAGVSFEFLLGKASAPAPVAAGPDGKDVQPPQTADGKTGLAPEQAPEPPARARPRGWLDPVARSPWPQVVLRDSHQTSRSSDSKLVRLDSPLDPDGCGCLDGPPLIFN